MFVVVLQYLLVFCVKVSFVYEYVRENCGEVFIIVSSCLEYVFFLSIWSVEDNCVFFYIFI